MAGLSLRIRQITNNRRGTTRKAKMDKVDGVARDSRTAKVKVKKADLRAEVETPLGLRVACLCSIEAPVE